MPTPPSLRVFLLPAVLLALSACTRVEIARTDPADLPMGAPEATARDDGWWSIAFGLGWDGEQAPEWSLDALLADQVCAPALAARRDRVALWRFHRRAAPDGAGHRFSLLVYTDPGTADALFARVRDDGLLRWLESEGHVVSVNLERLRPPDPPPIAQPIAQPLAQPIAQSSDAHWPPEIQASWPWYIMGVSQTWLSLIDQVKADEPLEGTSGGALLDYYRDVNDRVTALWRDYGQHVYLHHLNALFGYAPLVIRETNLKRF